jgi:hypothetical protein
MWRVNHADNERGASAVVVGLSMATLIAVLAVLINLGLAYSEHAQLQNGADAAALTIAQICGQDESDPQCSANSTAANTYANANANDGRTEVRPFIPNKQTNSVSITTSSLTPGSSGSGLIPFLGHLSGLGKIDAEATATASWGYPTKAKIVFPVAIAECKFKLPLNGADADVQLLSINSGGCSAGIPGGFGWLSQQGTAVQTCALVYEVSSPTETGKWFTTDPGANAPKGCGENVVHLQDRTVLLPLYETVDGTGRSGMYFVKGFASFHVTAYRFSELEWSKDGAKICNKCIKGRFVEFVSLSEAAEYGDAPDYGTSIVELTS